MPSVLVFPHPLSADIRLDMRKLAGGKVDSKERCRIVRRFPSPESREVSLKQLAFAVRALRCPWAAGAHQNSSY